MRMGIDSARNKIVRAGEHFQSLQSELQRYFQSHPGKIVRETGSDPNQYIANVETIKPIPTRVQFIIGDCLQNLRSSLDYLVRELVLAANKQPSDHEMFPICDKPKAFKDAIRRGQLTGVPEEAITEIERLQPYHLGQDWEKANLWVLNEFSNINKHRRVVLTMLRGTTAAIKTHVIDGELWMRGHLPTLDDNAKIILPMRGNQVEVNAQIVSFVTFQEGAAKGIEVTSCLNIILQEVYAVVSGFEKFFP
jgi:hypothetical protein